MALFIFQGIMFAIGVALFLLTARRYQRTGDPLLQSYSHYLLAVNAVAFESGLGESFFSLLARARNLPSSSVEATSQVLCLLSVPLLFISWFLFLRLIARITGQRMGRKVFAVYLAAQLIAAAAFAFMIAHFVSGPSRGSADAYRTAFEVVRWTGCFLRFWALSQIAFSSRAQQNVGHRKSLLRFGGIYAGLLAVHYGWLLLSPPRPAAIFVYSFIFFMVDYIPLIYLLMVLNLESRQIPAPSIGTDALDRLSAASGLTPREREIAALILAGRDNVDIHRALFISKGTVRNHVSNIYRKLGLRNRYQLMSLVLNGGGTASSSGDASKTGRPAAPAGPSAYRRS